MPDCDQMRQQISELKQERADLQERLQPFPGTNIEEKGRITTAIKRLNARIEKMEEELDTCLV